MIFFCLLRKVGALLQSNLVASTVDYFLAQWCLEAGEEGLAGIAVSELDGVALKGHAVRHSVSHRVLELFVACSDPCHSLGLVGRQGRGQNVAELVIPRGGQSLVLLTR
eukprot:TRINITY_DN1676_c0_g1_i13.p4 TRINITY_DN1676_c0_g1~~TRINITY_DN1676_c0_g1_i13.p4  ORF type:complete len:109 (-),score=8.93 TRINITY_DN1676_c0_g1_i13:693-1019(-)